MVFCIIQNFFSDHTRGRILIFLQRKAQIFFPEFNIRLYDKNSESDYFFFLHQNQNIFFSNIGNQNIFLEKKPYPPPFKLNGRSLSRIEEQRKIIKNTEEKNPKLLFVHVHVYAQMDKLIHITIFKSRRVSGLLLMQ